MENKTLKQHLENLIKYIKNIGQTAEKDWQDYFTDSCEACKKYCLGEEDCDAASKLTLEAYDTCKNTKDGQRYASTLLQISEHCGNSNCGTANRLRKGIEESLSSAE